MKNVLYLTNIEVPYRVKFFNRLAKVCNLTVLYERRRSTNRDVRWSCREKIMYNTYYLNGVSVGNENSFSLRICDIISRKWDVVIIGCYNSKVQILSMAYMRICNIPYIINLDGEPFIGDDVKAFVKKIILKGADAYLCAGEFACQSLKKVIGDGKAIFPYYFSSLSEDEIIRNGGTEYVRNKKVLVIGQYFDYKGMDVAYKVACMDKSINYIFVGMGNRTGRFISDMGEEAENVEIIPFLQKEELMVLYKECAALLLPTRQECWGLVVNEAASFGMPIVSTWGSGAAVEFLSDKYPCYLAQPEDVETLLLCVKKVLSANNSEYIRYLKDKSLQYSIERNVSVYAEVLKKSFG